MYSVENRAGKLIEIRLATPMDGKELEQFQLAHHAACSSVEGPLVFAVDARRAHVFPPSIVSGLIEIMSMSNPRVERSAFLISDSATFSLQAARGIREARSPNRKAFHSAEELEGWLREALDPDECQSLHRFLGSPTGEKTT